ncbi:hypothetical protein SAMN05421805_12530 [Saccharopolyspora antimicrobica]|uniref:Uncharacterized protein n=1 Tax=Saccharopolyspora antimicrobica TaxID=455193 RepID=A0A1I5K2Z2_9PSEU|nr:hypothetical protein [Saccharopolyspora antimicrobica]RKT84770.1 hypothetical protein ATL45_3095 [Saccharopolyspora antimicrobica]SFO79425.1 hypothetical protein SAMN05421805_12530 [Saccharopolyspora antimicrobica]
MAGLWEQVLSYIAESAPTSRDEVTGLQWISGVEVGGLGAGGNWDIKKFADATQATTHVVATPAGSMPVTTTTSGTVGVGLRMNNAEFEKTDGPWAKLLKTGSTILDPLVHAPHQNTVVSIPSFNYAIDALTKMAAKVEAWADRFGQEAKEVETGGNFKGETAKSFQSLLQNAGLSLKDFAKLVGDPQVLQSLADSRDKQLAEAVGLLNGWINWRDHPSKLMSPSIATKTVFDENVTQIVHVNGSVTKLVTNWGTFDVSDSSWSETLRGHLENGAKDKWKAHFAEHLDGEAQKVHPPLYTSLMTTANRIKQNPKLQPFASSYSANKDDQANKQIEDLKKDLDKTTNDLKNSQDEVQNSLDDKLNQSQQDLNDQLNQSKEQTSGLGGATGLENSDLTGGGGAGGGLGEDTDIDAPELDALDENETLAKNNTPESLGLGNSSLNDDKLGLGGGPLGLGGGPITSGLGGSSMKGGGPDGLGTSSIFTPDGEVMRGPDGTPLSVPNGSVINPDGTVTKPDGSKVLGPDGKPLVLPQGSSIKPNTSLLSPSGSPYLGPDGRPIYGPQGSSLSPTGHLLDPNGRMIFGPGGKPITVPDAVHNSTKLATGPGKQLNLGPAEIGDPAKRSTVNSSALDDKLRKPFSIGTESMGPGGRSGQNGQQPMMPPPMAGGGAGGQGERERQKTTWLSEEEETWGATGGFTGAIGR